MVAYSFQRRFAEPILDGTKGGTIRGERKRHARPGEEMQLYSGMRTKHCRLIARKTCLDVDRIRLEFAPPGLVLIWSGRHSGRGITIALPGDLDAFARFDGFRDWRELREFWARDGVFLGVHVRWLPLPSSLSMAERVAA